MLNISSKKRNANQNYEISLHTQQNSYKTKQNTRRTNIRKDIEKIDAHTFLMGIENDALTLANSGNSS